MKSGPATRGERSLASRPRSRSIGRRSASAPPRRPRRASAGRRDGGHGREGGRTTTNTACSFPTARSAGSASGAGSSSTPRGRPIRMRGASIDISARKQAEQEMLRLRQDIAHVGRVSVMGQLASALAHEINQPLGAILRNAEAAALFMQHPSPDLDEISAILEDIRKDDERAGDVIDRMRALLRRQTVEMQPLDVARCSTTSRRCCAPMRPPATSRSRSTSARSAAGARRPGAAPAGAAQPDPQRHGCARRGGPEDGASA